MPLISNPTIFHNAKYRTFIITYINNCLLIRPSKAYINRLKKVLNRTYTLEDKGLVAFFLGIQIIRDRPKRTLFLQQPQYIKQAIEIFRLVDAKPIIVPIQPNIIRLTPKAIEAIGLLDPKNYTLFQRIIGTLIYLIYQTRLDIAYIVQQLSQAIYKPYKIYLLSTKGLLQYLKGTKNLTITFIPIGSLQPIGYSNSDFAGDKASSKSTYSYLFSLVGGAISQKSKKASTIALSTIEAKSNSLIEAIRELQQIQGLFKELGEPLAPITLYYNNQGTIVNASNPTLYQQTKYTLLKFYYNRVLVSKGLVKLLYLEINAMPIDSLTKALIAPIQQRFINLLGLLEYSKASKNQDLL